MEPGECSICNKPLKDEEIKRNVRYLGLQTLIGQSKKIQDEKWKEWEKLSKEQYLVVHDSCGKRYTKQSDKPLSERKKPKLADPTNDDTDAEPPAKPFDYETLCMMCDKPLDAKHKKVHALNTQLEQTNIVEWSKSTDDEHAKEIVRRIRYLRNSGTIGKYHVPCRSKCRKLEPYIPKTDNRAIEKAFETVTSYIENSGEYKFNISMFRKIMDESDVEPLSEYVLSKKLEEKYGDDIFIDRHIGKPPLYFYKTNSLFGNSTEWLANPQSLSDFDKSILMKLAADIIKHEVLHKHNESKNDSSGENSLTTASSALETFADRLLQGTPENSKNVKRNSITQSIIRSVWLKKFTPDPVLKEIFCYCVGDCSSIRCTCRKISSKCSQLCKNCNNQSCSNYPLVQLPVEVEYGNPGENVVFENVVVENVNNDEINDFNFVYATDNTA